MYFCRIVADSIADTPDATRLTTFEITYPRFLLPELNTHRMLSKNTASSRAIPVSKRILSVVEDPVIPISFGKNTRGMQAKEELDSDSSNDALSVWLKARDYAICCAKEMADIGVHKQIANRILEPFLYVTTLVTGTDWENFFSLRCNSDAQPEIQKIADMMAAAYSSKCNARIVPVGGWHLPMVFEEDFRSGLSNMDLLKVSVGRCARVSALCHDGRRDPSADIALHDRLLESRHMSPFEHQAVAKHVTKYVGNFKGWHQYRKMIPGECYTTFDWEARKNCVSRV